MKAKINLNTNIKFKTTTTVSWEGFRACSNYLSDDFLLVFELL